MATWPSNGSNVDVWDAALLAWLTDTVFDNDGTFKAGSPMAQIAALARDDGNIIVGDGSAWVAESGDTARTSLGLGTADSPKFAGVTIAGLTGGRIPFASTAGLMADSPYLLWNDTDKSLHIGKPDSTVMYPLSVSQEGASTAFYVMFSSHSDTASQAPHIYSIRKRGTIDSPLAVLAGDHLGTLSFGGAYGSGPGDAYAGVRIRAYAAENWTSTARGEYVVIETTNTGGTTRTEKVRINPNGNVGIGTGNPGATLHVVGTAFPAAMVQRNIAGTGDISSSFLLHRQNTTPRDGDGTGFVFGMLNDDAQSIYYARISGVAADVSGGVESGRITFDTMSAGGALSTKAYIEHDGGLHLPYMKTGATQVAAGAAAGELWATASHATLPDNVVMIGV